MTEKPILFSGPMIRAILDGSKTQTRRVVKDQPSDEWRPVVEHYHPIVVRRNGEEEPGPEIFGASDADEGRKCPYGQPGDRLWVRETWLPDPPCDGTWPDVEFNGCKSASLSLIPKRYRTPEHCIFREGWVGSRLVWKSAIHMPRWASRITLEVTGVRVERLQDCSHDDAREEGIFNNATFYGKHNRYPGLVGDGFMTPREAYAHLWDSLNADRGYGWDASPWVWVIKFERVTP